MKMIQRTDTRSMNTSGLSGVGLYVHIPFCETKCGYCDFYSVAVKDRDTSPLVEGVIQEIETRLGDNAYRVQTVFCGGGTPTILPAYQLETLLKTIARFTPVDHLQEFTVEANPATVDREKAALLKASGVNRVSMGAQSFYPDELETLERIHSPDDIAPSVKVLRDQGIEQINLDLIFGIPGQTLETWSGSLQQAIALKLDHLACYGLMYEPATRLTAMKRTGRITPCDEQLEADMFELTIDVLGDAGYRQYEISNFAKPGCESLHNLMYWRNEPYVGVGPSAAGCVDGRRYKNIADVGGYLAGLKERGHAESESEVLDCETLMHEMVLMQLRLVEGLSIQNFYDRTGANPVELFGEVLSRFVDEGYVTVSDTHISLTRRGRLVTNSIMTDLALRCGLQDVSLPIVE